MEQRRIAFVGLEPHTINACLSMLGIMANSANVIWHETTPNQADVLMVDRNKTTSLPNNIPQIIVYPSTEPRPSTCYPLAHPFRAMQLIELLESIHEQQQPAPAEAPKLAGNYPPYWQQITNITCQPPPQEGVVPCQTSLGTFYIKPRTRTFFASQASVQQLASTPVHINAIADWQPAVPKGLIQKPIFLLAWYLVADVDGLLPCLGSRAVFRLKRWPYLTAIPRSRELLTLCALLSRNAIAYQQLRKITQCQATTTNQFLNATLVSGLLQTQKTTQPTPATRKPPATKNRFGHMIHSLRSRLGLAQLTRTHS